MRILERTIVSYLKRHQLILLSALLALFSLHLALTEKKEVTRGVILREVLSFTVTPVQQVILGAHDAVTGVWTDYINLVWVREENDTLKNTLLAVQNENSRLKEEIMLNGRLKEILDYRDSAPFKTMAASIVGVSVEWWTRTVIINKGYADGIARDMAVVSPAGVVGRVINVNRHTSSVLLDTDTRSDIDVIVSSTRVKGVAEGNGTDGLTLKYIRQIDNVQVGDKVITSGLSGVFPKGLAVGEVTRIEKGKDNFFKYLEVRPEVDFQRLEEVLVVTDTGNSINE